LPWLGAAFGLVVLAGCFDALPEVLVAVPDRAPVSSAQAPRSSPPAPRAAQSQSLFISMRCSSSR